MRHASPFRRRWVLVALTGALVLAGAGLTGTHLASAAAAGCSVNYSVTSQWPGGFGASVSVTNLGDAVNGWRLTWSFTAGQTITQLWNGSYAQSGAAVRVTNASWNAAIAVAVGVVGPGMNRRHLPPPGDRWGTNARRDAASDVDNGAPLGPSSQPPGNPGVVLPCEDAAQRLDGNRGAFRPTD